MNKLITVRSATPAGGGAVRRGLRSACRLAVVAVGGVCLAAGGQTKDELYARFIELTNKMADEIGRMKAYLSEVLQNAQRGELPGQLAFFITALAVRDLEPMGLRYFKLQSNGSVHYLNKMEIRSLEDRSAQRRKSTGYPLIFQKPLPILS